MKNTADFVVNMEPIIPLAVKSLVKFAEMP